MDLSVVVLTPTPVTRAPAVLAHHRRFGVAVLARERVLPAFVEGYTRIGTYKIGWASNGHTRSDWTYKIPACKTRYPLSGYAEALSNPGFSYWMKIYLPLKNPVEHPYRVRLRGAHFLPDPLIRFGLNLRGILDEIVRTFRVLPDYVSVAGNT